MRPTIAYVDNAINSIPNPQEGNVFVNASTGAEYEYDGQHWRRKGVASTDAPEQTVPEEQPVKAKAPAKRTRKKATE